MKIDDVREAYRYNSGRASESVRQLGIAAIAIVWVLRPPTGANELRLPVALLWSGALATISLALDFLQYLYGTIAWGAEARKREQAGILEFHVDAWINRPTLALFVLKTFALAGCYLALLGHLIARIRSG